MAFATDALVANNAVSGVLAFSSGSSWSSGGVSVDFDLTFVLQMLLFLILAVALKPLLFDPILRVFEEREKRTDGARSEAREMQEKAGELLRQYEAELRRLNETAAAERDRIRAETAKLEAEILADARETTSRILEQGRTQIESQVDKIRFDLGRQSEVLARQLASEALGREVR